MKIPAKNLLALAILTTAVTVLTQLTTMDSAQAGAQPMKCALAQIEACQGQGDYTVINELGQQMSKCETGRAAIDTLNYLIHNGVCSKND